MDRVAPKGYSSVQIGLHWAIAALILLQFLASGGMENAWGAFEDGDSVDGEDLRFAYFHVGTGLSIFVLALLRVWLRFTRGAPALPEKEPRILKFLAHATHFLIYALIIGMPMSGAAAWVLGIEAAADAHEAATNVLLALVILHVVGALAQQFVLKTDVLTRMVMTKD